MNIDEFKQEIIDGIPSELPKNIGRKDELAHAPKRDISSLSPSEVKLALKNALRYFPSSFHQQLSAEFLEELKTYGRIYMYRFMPRYSMHARPIEHYPAKCNQAAGIMLMIQNNLDPLVAKYPEELITYGGNGAVFQNWAQYLLTMQYLSMMTEKQTLVMYSGHPMGLFPSHKDAPRVVVTNGMMIPNYSSKEDWNKYNALGVTQYGQMTAGSYMYIGPQGIVHGTTITLLNAGRKMGLKGQSNLAGMLYVTSGLGGMSGAQALAAIITGAVGVIAEVDDDAIAQRLADGYIQNENVYKDLSKCLHAIKTSIEAREAIAIVYHGNIVELLEQFAENNFKVHLCSDQTSLHNIDDLGYCPVGYNFLQAQDLMLSDRKQFNDVIRDTLKRHVTAINKLSAQGTYFWDYGNAFLKEAGDAGADVYKSDGSFRYPSYVEDIMGPMCFDYGFGPFRWVCCSGAIEDLNITDQIAAEVIRDLMISAPTEIQDQLRDNLNWIERASDQIPVVGSKSRILYADAVGRIQIAEAFNDAIRDGRLSGPIILGRDHHDVSGTDSPYRETANIYDGSSFTADMAIQNVIGDAFRGATWVSIHNGGGVGWGEVINGGFGMLIDGTDDAARRLKAMLYWDVNNGIARRSWARNEGAISTAKRAMKENVNLKITLPNIPDDQLLDDLIPIA